MLPEDDFAAILAASSLGAPGVQSLAACTSPEDVDRVLRRVKELQAEERRNQLLADQERLGQRQRVLNTPMPTGRQEQP